MTENNIIEPGQLYRDARDGEIVMALHESHDGTETWIVARITKPCDGLIDERNRHVRCLNDSLNWTRIA